MRTAAGEEASVEKRRLGRGSTTKAAADVSKDEDEDDYDVCKY